MSIYTEDEVEEEGEEEDEPLLIHFKNQIKSQQGNVLLKSNISGIWNEHKESLDYDQLNIADHHKSVSLFVSAGPGSGKTRTLSSRIIFNAFQGVGFENMLVLCFTKNAVHEIKDRMLNIFGPGIRNLLRIETIHGYSLSEVNKHRKDEKENMIEILQTEQIVEIIEKNELFVNINIFNESMDIDVENNAYSVINELRLKNLRNNPKNQLSEKEKKILEKFTFILDNYGSKNTCKKDYFALLVEYHELLKSGNAGHIETITHLYLDECQDVGNMMLENLKLMSVGKVKYFTGDIFQDIYKFLSSKVNFEEIVDSCFGGMVHAKLSKNYRSNKKISLMLDAFKGIEINKNKIPNEECIFVSYVKDFQAEMEAARDIILSCRTDGKSCFISSRTNVTMERFSKFLKSKKIVHELWSDFSKKKSDVCLGSCHRFKGSECDVKVVFNFIMSEFPYYRNSFSPKVRGISKDYETGERNVVFVALSRAREEIYMLLPLNTKECPSFFGKMFANTGESKYLKEIMLFCSKKFFSEEDHPDIANCSSMGNLNKYFDKSWF